MSREVDAEEFYQLIRSQKRQNFWLLILGMLMIIASIVIVSIAPTV